MNQSGSIAVVTILLALIIKAALETTFKPLFEGTAIWSDILGLPFAQLLVFFLLTLRFYLGTVRFGTTEPKRIDFLIRTFNFVFAFAVFCAFYALALSVTKSEFFYLEIIVLHVIDGAWFGILYCLSHLRFVDVNELEDGELLIEPVRRVMLIYFFFSLFTVLFGLLVYWLLGVSITESNPNTAHWCYLAFLVFMSGIDFWALFKYYFHFEEWCAERCFKKEVRTT
jgi:hypothetical protein